MLTRSKHKATMNQVKPAEQGHDRIKQRYVDQDSIFLQYLGITDQKAQIIPEHGA